MGRETFKPKRAAVAPRARGWAGAGVEQTRRRRGCPARTGMGLWACFTSVPRNRGWAGDAVVRVPVAPVGGDGPFSRMRGCTNAGLMRRVCPAPAGMRPWRFGECPARRGWLGSALDDGPRTGMPRDGLWPSPDIGDGPRRDTILKNAKKVAPRSRGWPAANAMKELGGCPASTGMGRAMTIEASVTQRLPRAHGDGPAGDAAMGLADAPHTGMGR